ncbi:MAG: restriction endonuclease subunit S [Polyangiaceae bacterium]
MNAALTQLWSTRSLANCGQFFSGGTPNRSMAEYWGGTIPWISAKSLKTFRVSDSEERVTVSGAENGTRMVPAGTLLFVVRGMSLAKEFRVAVTTGPVTFNQDLRALVPSSDVDPVYLTHFLRASEQKILGLVDHASHGTTRLTSDRMDGFEIPIPPLAEQRRIAEVLDRAEALRTKRRAALAQLDTLTQSIFLDLFGDPVSNSKKFPDTKVLGDVADLASGITKGRVLRGQSTRTVPYLAVVNVQDRRLDLSLVKEIEASEDEINRYRLVQDDLLLTEGGDPDKLGRGTLWRGELPECIHQNHIFRVRLTGDELDPLFLNWLVGSQRGKRYFLRSAKQTTGIASINMGQLKKFPLLIPPIALQHDFARRIAAVEKLKSTQCASLDELDALFASLQHRAFRGEL